MDLEIMILNEVSQTETNIHHHLYVNSKKKKKNSFIKQKNTYRHRKQTYGYQKGNRGRDKSEVWNQHKHTTI